MKKLRKIFALLFMAAIMMFTFSTPALASTNLEEGTYKVTITSLVSKAPLKPVKEAFAKGFGDFAYVNVSSDGRMTATMQNQHMVITMTGKDNDANVLTIKGATVESTKTEAFTNPKTKEQETVTCPDVFTIPLDLDSDNSEVLTITVDYMNQFLGGGDDYETDVTLTLDMANAEKVADGTTFEKAETTTVAAADTTEVAEETTSTMKTSTKVTIAVVAVVVILAIIVVIVIKKKNDDKIYEEYIARKKAEENQNKEKEND